MRQVRAAHIIPALALVLIIATSGAVRAAEATGDEYTVKAAMVYNFVRFTTWPPAPAAAADTSFRIAVYGERDLTQAFSGLDGREVDGRQIDVTYVDSPDDVAGCQLLFLTAGGAKNLPDILRATAGAPILTVGESGGFLQSGGMINLHLAGNRIRFQVNLDNARDRNLKISSRLLRLASLVVSDGGEKR